MTWLLDLDAFQGDRALDVGTGAGHLAHELAGRYTEVVGIDLPDVIGRAIPHEGVTFTGMDATQLTFADASFDLVAISWSLHHLTHPSGVLAEMWRVLAPGGIFLIIEPFVADTGTNQDLHLAAHQLVAEADRHQGKPHYPVFQRMQIGSVIQGLGLVDLHFKPLMALAEEAEWDLATSIEAASFFAKKVDDIANHGDFPLDLRERAKQLVVRLNSEGIRTSPTMRTYGYKPAKGG
jgi:SAM-dependent methyltransferase